MPWSGNGLGHFNLHSMINWANDKWEDVKFILDELEYDYESDFEGNLILHFKSFDIVDENNKRVVDTVDRMWLKFVFSDSGTSYRIHWSRLDLYESNTNYSHPHVNGTDHCTGDYSRGLSLVKDIIYYTDYVKRYNSGNGYTSIPTASSATIDRDKLNKHLIPTFYFDVTLGHPVVKEVEFDGDVNDFVKKKALSNPKRFFWKGEQYQQYSKGSKLEHFNLKDYFNYEKYFERYNKSARIVSNADVVPEAQ